MKAHKKSEKTIFLVLGVFLLIIIIDLWFCVEGQSKKQLPYYLEFSKETLEQKA